MLDAVKITPGTKTNPTIVPTVESSRTIACVCKYEANAAGH